MRIRGCVRLPPQQRDLERPQLRGRQVAAHLVKDVPDEIAERGVRKLRLRFGRSRLQHAIASLAAPAYCLRPHSCLADAGLALDHEPHRPIRHALKEACERRRFAPASKHLGHYSCTALIFGRTRTSTRRRSACQWRVHGVQRSQLVATGG